MVAMPILGMEVTMLLRPLLPDHRSLALDEVRLTPDGITVFVASMLPNNRCPLCDQSSTRVHSRYQRKLADLPWQGLAVRIYWCSRKFFCDNSACPQRVFTERLPDVAKPYARKTCRMAAVFGALGFACGGEGGARLAERLGMPVSPDTLLRFIRRQPLPSGPTPRVLGVDDWAFRRGQRYGTILCDLERHRVVDLLPERSVESFQTWLSARPGVEIISRVRGDYYAKGATAGAPNATQVVDRWHLLSNLQKVLIRIADRHAQQLLVAARSLPVRQQVAEVLAPVVKTSPPSETPENKPNAAITCHPRSDRRRRCYEQVMELHHRGLSQCDIARRLGIDRSTAGKYVHANGFPERAKRTFRRKTDRFVDYLWRRWQEGCHNAVKLAKELEQQGFKGSYYPVRRRIAAWRQRDSSQLSPASVPDRTKQRLSSRRVAWLMLKPEAELEDDERALVKAVDEHCPPLKIASALARRFRELLRQKRAEELGGWIEESSGRGIPEELRRFAKGLNPDRSAVEAALTLPWSNGPTEGHVNRLKLIKRQMFGRAKFDLLRQRVLCAC